MRTRISLFPTMLLINFETRTPIVFERCRVSLKSPTCLTRDSLVTPFLQRLAEKTKMDPNDDRLVLHEESDPKCDANSTRSPAMYAAASSSVRNSFHETNNAEQPILAMANCITPQHATQTRSSHAASIDSSTMQRSITLRTNRSDNNRSSHKRATTVQTPTPLLVESASIGGAPLPIEFAWVTEITSRDPQFWVDLHLSNGTTVVLPHLNEASDDHWFAVAKDQTSAKQRLLARFEQRDKLISVFETFLRAVGSPFAKESSTLAVLVLATAVALGVQPSQPPPAQEAPAAPGGSKAAPAAPDYKFVPITS